MTDVVRVALGRDFVLACPLLPSAQGVWTLTFFAQDQNAERLHWMRRQWDQRYWACAFVEVEGHPRSLANAPDVIGDNHVLARVGFLLSDTLLADLRAGALVGVGIDHPRYPAVVALRSADRQRLWQRRPDA